MFCREAAPTHPDYGSVAWAVCQIVPQTRPLVNELGEQKRGYLQTLLLLVTGPPAAIMDPAVLLAVLSSLRKWILDPAFAQGPLQLRLLVLNT